MTNYNTARINAFCSNDDNFEAVSYDDPRAVALRAKSARAYRAKQDRIASQKSMDEAAAVGMAVGDRVQVAHGCYATITKINGGFLTVDTGRQVRMIRATMVIA